jgi:hypothetical protein
MTSSRTARCSRQHSAWRSSTNESGTRAIVDLPAAIATGPEADRLLLEATRGVTIALVSSRERKRRQPGLATDDPAFVGRHQLVRGIQGSQVYLDFVGAARENGGAAAGTEKSPVVVACLALDRHRILREHRGSVEEGPMMLAAVETVTKADPVRRPRSHYSNIAAQATARESVQASSPLEPRRTTGA